MKPSLVLLESLGPLLTDGKDFDPGNARSSASPTGSFGRRTTRLFSLMRTTVPTVANRCKFTDWCSAASAPFAMCRCRVVDDLPHSSRAAIRASNRAVLPLRCSRWYPEDVVCFPAWQRGLCSKEMRFLLIAIRVTPVETTLRQESETNISVDAICVCVGRLCNWSPAH